MFFFFVAQFGSIFKDLPFGLSVITGLKGEEALRRLVKMIILEDG